MSHLKSRVEPGWGMRKDKGKENGMLKKIEKKEGSPEREGDSTCPPEVNSSWTERKFNGKKKNKWFRSSSKLHAYKLGIEVFFLVVGIL